ncbi:MAG: mechanosensitive ion channel [Candidatus Symbiobacter sp.]|nr:mechanosensitive ion channel [Candidatus Symbiobacter sp.]
MRFGQSVGSPVFALVRSLVRPQIRFLVRPLGLAVGIGLIGLVGLAGLVGSAGRVEASTLSSTAEAVMPASAVIPASAIHRLIDPAKPSNLTKAEIQALIKTLDDPAKRLEFISQLQTITNFEKKAESKEMAAIPGLALAVSSSVIDAAVEFAQDLRDVGHEIWNFQENWPRYQNYLLQYSLDDDIAPLIHQRLGYLAAMFGVGLAVGRLFRSVAAFPFGRWMRRIWARTRKIVVAEPQFMAKISILPSLREEVFSALGFVLGYAGTALFLDFDRALHAASIALFGAAMAVRGALILMQSILSPEISHNFLSIRLSPRRVYALNRWLHQVIALVIYGVLGLGVLRLIELPAILRVLAIHLIGLLLLLLAYRALWQLRHFGRRPHRRLMTGLGARGEDSPGKDSSGKPWANLSIFNPNTEPTRPAPITSSPLSPTAPQSVATKVQGENASASAAAAAAPEDEDDDHTVFSRAYHRLQQIWWLVAGFYLTIVYLGWVFEFHGALIAFLEQSGITLLIAWGSHWLLRGVEYYFGGRGVLAVLPLSKKFGFLRRLQWYLPIIRLGLRWFLLGSCLVFLLEEWRVPVLAWLFSGTRWVVMWQIISIILIVMGTILLWELISAWIEHALREHERKIARGESPKRARTLLPILRNALLVALAISGGIFVLGQLGVHSNTILAGAGFISIGLGFGAQTIIRDIITGLFIVMEDTINIGDLIMTDNVKGTVEAMTLRNICLRDKDGALHTIPFNRVAAVANFSRDYSIYRVTINVSLHNDAQKIFDIMTSIDRELRATPPFDTMILEPMIIEGVENFTEHGVVIAGAQKTLATQQYDVYRAFHFRLMKAFSDHHINLPEQHVVVKGG